MFITSSVCSGVCINQRFREARHNSDQNYKFDYIVSGVSAESKLTVFAYVHVPPRLLHNFLLGSYGRKDSTDTHFHS